MALINCPECGTEVSSNAAACPRCAHPINTALTQRQLREQGLGAVTPQRSSAQELRDEVVAPLIEHENRKSSGGATGALIGATLGYFLMASSCGMPETMSGFTMTLFMWSPVIIIGMIMGSLLGKAVS